MQGYQQYLITLLLVCLPQTALFGAQQVITGVPGVANQRGTVHINQTARSRVIPGDPPQPPQAIHSPLPVPRNRTRPVRPAEPSPTAVTRPTISLSPPGVPPTLVSSFLALDDNGTSIPPDTHGAVGIGHLMVTLNTQVRIQDRSGGVISTESIDDFWTGFFSSRTFDPKVLYDHMADRWIFTAMGDPAASTSSVLMGVSQTSDPTGVWNIYRIDADPTNISWADYPSMGYNKDWIVVQVNMFTISGSSFTGSNIYVYNKADLYAGGTGLFTLFQDDDGGSQTPAITYDDTLSTMYLIETWDGSDGSLRITTVTGQVGAEVYTTNLPFSATNDTWVDITSSTNFAPQLGSSLKIATNDSRMQNTVYRNGSLWCTHHIFLPSGSPTRSAVQWWEIRPSETVLQQGRIDDPAGGKFYAFPTIAVNKDNDVLIGYSRFGADQYVSSNYSYRSGNDLPNTLQADTVIKDGEAKYFKTFGTGRNRWGDYSNTVVDPVDDTGMWTIQQYAALPDPDGGSNADKWGTWWGQLAPQPSIPNISVVPSSIDFGGVGIGEDAPQLLTIHNDGTGDLTISDIDDATGMFDISDTTLAISLNDSAVVTVTFSPASSGFIADTLVIISDDPDTPVVKAPVSAIGVRRGDVNDDGTVTILDVIVFIRIILGKDAAPDPGTASFYAADANGDGTLNVIDVVRQINTILGISTKPVAGVLGPPAQMSLAEPQTLGSGQLTIPVMMDTDGSIAGLQVAFTFDPLRLAVGTPELTGIGEGMSIQSHRTGGTLHTVIYSPTGQVIAPGQGMLLSIPVTVREGTSGTSAITLSQLILVDRQAQAMGIVPGKNTVKVATIPSVFDLKPSRPNPFNPSTTIVYDVPQQAHITLVVYNLLGQEVVRLVDGGRAPGRYQTFWHGRNTRGQAVSSGVYVYRLTSSTGFGASRRMTLLK